MSGLKVVIVDDEPAARRGLQRLLGEHADCTVVGEADSSSTAQQLLRDTAPDVAFLDVELPGTLGFDLLEHLPAHTKVVFVTAHTQYAPRAFEVEALDYLLKPLRAARLAQTMDRLRRAFAPGTVSSPDEPRFSLKDQMTLRYLKRTHVVPVESIAALQAEGDFTRFHISGQSSLLMSYSLQNYEAQMPSPPFVRIGRSLVVNLRHVATIGTESRDETALMLHGIEKPLILRRTAASRLRVALTQYQ